LGGPLPSTIGLLTALGTFFFFVLLMLLANSSLQVLFCYGNRLETFVSQENQHTGAFPTEFYTLMTLRKCTYRCAEVWNVRSLTQWFTSEKLIVGFNTLDSSPLLTEIGLLTNLDTLIIPNANLIGSIPSEIGMLSKLSKSRGCPFVSSEATRRAKSSTLSCLFTKSQLVLTQQFINWYNTILFGQFSGC
jgi:hypothetical protein